MRDNFQFSPVYVSTLDFHDFDLMPEILNDSDLSDGGHHRVLASLKENRPLKCLVHFGSSSIQYLTRYNIKRAVIFNSEEDLFNLRNKLSWATWTGYL